jgi:hypothetical protein
MKIEDTPEMKLVGTYEAHFITCPKHGEHPHTIVSTIKGFEGAWCQICWLESLGEPLTVEKKRVPFGDGT